MAVRIAIANHKGGVAKSTTTMMTVEGLSLFHGLRVLAIDMDPQASLSTMLLSREGADHAAASGRSLAKLLTQIATGEKLQISKLMSLRASDLIELRDAGDVRRVDLIASSRNLLAELGAIERHLRERYHARLDVAIAAALAPELERISKSYDVVVFDCPAGTGPLHLAALRLAHLVIAPTVLDSVSLTALSDFLKIILQQDLALANNMRLKVLPTLYQANDPEQRQILDRIRSRNSKLDAITRPIPATVHIRRAVERIRPDSYRRVRAKYDAAIPDLEALADTIASIIKSLEG